MMGPAAVTSEPAEEASGPAMHSYPRGTPITVVGGDGVALGHGYMIDAQFDVGTIGGNLDDEARESLFPASFVQQGWYNHIKLTHVGRGQGGVQLRKDDALSHEGDVFEHQRERTMTALSEQAEGVVIYCDYIRKRQRSLKRKQEVQEKKKKTTKGKKKVNTHVNINNHVLTHKLTSLTEC